MSLWDPVSKFQTSVSISLKKLKIIKINSKSQFVTYRYLHNHQWPWLHPNVQSIHGLHDLYTNYSPSARNSLWIQRPLLKLPATLKFPGHRWYKLLVMWMQQSNNRLLLKISLKLAKRLHMRPSERIYFLRIYFVKTRCKPPTCDSQVVRMCVFVRMFVELTLKLESLVLYSK